MLHRSRHLAALAAALLCLHGLACSDDPQPPSVTPDMREDAPDDQQTTPDQPDEQPDQPDEQPDTPDPIVPETPEQEAILGVETSELISLPGLSGPVQVVYNAQGVPHVYASNREDMARVLGFVVGRDRFFVMDLQRRLGLGTISSMLGQDGLDSDLESRLTGMPDVAQRLLDNVSEEQGAYLDAFAAGINAYIATVEAGTGKAPSELATLGLLLGESRRLHLLMDPFTRRDLAAMITVIMYQTNFETGDVGRTRRADNIGDVFPQGSAPHAALRRAGAIEDIWESVKPVFDVSSASGFEIERGDAARTMSRRTPRLTKRGGALSAPPRVERDMLQRASARLDRLNTRLGRREVENFGSNTWAVAGDRAVDGWSLLASDGHLPLSVPALFYQVGLDTKTFGGGDMRQSGLLITGLPLMAVGTNGDIAWGQVNPVADITDWYREQLRLDADGKPEASLFQGQWRPLTQLDDTYTIANVAALGSVGRDETWSRWLTFDGRRVFDIEGRAVANDYQAQPGETIVNLAGRKIVPEDMDNDGVISAVSFDYTAFDTTAYVDTLDKFGFAKDVFDYQDATRGLIGNMLYSAVADGAGNILFTSYQAVPCRSYLPRDPETGRWIAGADPTVLIDGTTYGGFTIPSDAQGRVDEGPGQTDPYKCVVPFDETPQAINPSQGFVANANNQPAPITDDGTFDNDPWYIGGPWSEFRADTIARRLTDAIAEGRADLDEMSSIQGDSTSRLGEVFTPAFVAALEDARALSARDPAALADHEQRLLALYTSRAAQLDEVAQRLRAWQTRGFNTPSGVATFYHTPAAGDLDDSVATMIFNAWLPRAMSGTFNDEQVDIWRFSGTRSQVRALHFMLQGRGADNPGQQAGWFEATGEHIFFDVKQTEPIERSEEILLQAALDALTFLEGAPSNGGQSGGFGTAQMSQWLWGLRHQVKFESLLADFLEGSDQFASLLNRFAITTARLPLAPNLTDDDPREPLQWFPRPGDNFGVDAASPGFSGTSFTHGSGPVMRMVFALKGGLVRGRNIIPGGQSALTDSPHFADQARLWLANETIRVAFTPAEVAEDGVKREDFRPAP